MTIQEVAKRLDKSEKTIRRWIKQGKLSAEIVDGKYAIDESALDVYLNEQDLSTQETQVSTQSEEGYLKEQLQWLKEQNEKLGEELAKAREEAAEASQRHDTIVLQMTRQLEQSQRLLEHHQQPWYKRVLKRKKPSEE